MDEALYTHAIKFLTIRTRSEKEVRDNLRKVLSKSVKKTGTYSQYCEVQIQEKIEEIIHKLKEQKFLNDKEFALWWIRQRSLLNPKGWYVLELELQQKGIAEEIIKELQVTNSKAAEEEAWEIPTQIELAKKLAEKQIKKYHGLSKHTIYQRLGGFLGRRGFDVATIKAVIDQMLQK